MYLNSKNNKISGIVTENLHYLYFKRRFSALSYSEVQTNKKKIHELTDSRISRDTSHFLEIKIQCYPLFSYWILAFQFWDISAIIIAFFAQKYYDKKLPVKSEINNIV